MAAIPYMPLYVADYLADAAHLSTVEHGAYLLLLMTYWQQGQPLPNDDRKLARIARLGPREWQKVKPQISEFFEVTCSNWVQKRVETELANVRAKSLQKRKAGLARAQQMQSERTANAQRSDTDTDTSIPLAKANGAVVDFPRREPDPDKAFWDGAKAFLGAHKSSMIGRWVSAHGREATAAAIAEAQVARAVDPIPYVERTLRNRRSGGDDDFEFGPC